MGMGVKTAWLCLKKNIVGEVPQDCVDLIYGNQWKKVSRTVQCEQATQSLTGDEETSWRRPRDYQSVLRKVTGGKQFCEKGTKQSQTPLQLVDLNFQKEPVQESCYCGNDGGGTKRSDDLNIKLEH